VIGRVISGGQTGADQAGWRAARAYGVPTGGAMPRGFLTEEGLQLEFAERYRAFELPTNSYPERTRRNVADSEGTLWFGDHHSTGGRTTLDACREQGKPFLIVFVAITKPSQVRDWLEEKGIRPLNVAGNRESTSPGIGERVERFLGVVLRGARSHDGGREPGGRRLHSDR